MGCFLGTVGEIKLYENKQNKMNQFPNKVNWSKGIFVHLPEKPFFKIP